MTGRPPGPPLTRLTLNITPETEAALEIAMRRTGRNQTETINYAIQLYDDLTRIASKDGNKGRIVDIGIVLGRSFRLSESHDQREVVIL